MALLQYKIDENTDALKLWLEPENDSDPDIVDDLKYELEKRGDVFIWHDLLEPHFTNGQLIPVSPEQHFVGLTSDPFILAEEATLEDDDSLTVTGRCWSFPGYEIHSPVDLLLDGQTVVMPCWLVTNDLVTFQPAA
jgi:hypothetical protein